MKRETVHENVKWASGRAHGHAERRIMIYTFTHIHYAYSAC